MFQVVDLLNGYYFISQTATCFSGFVVRNNIHLIVLNDIFNNVWRMLHCYNI